MKEFKNNTVVGFLAGIVAAMLLFHVGTGSFSNRSKAAPQAPVALPAITIAISPTVSPATTPERTQAFSKSDEPEAVVRHHSKAISAPDKSLSGKVSNVQLRARGSQDQAAQAESSAQGTSIPPGGSPALPVTAAPTHKPSKVRKIFGAVGKIALASVIPGQVALGNAAQAINQQTFPSTQSAEIGLAAPSAQVLPGPTSTANIPPKMLNSTAPPTSIASAPATGAATTSKPGKMRRFFGALDKAVRVEVGSGNTSAGKSMQPVVTPILPQNAGCTLREDQCKGDATQMKAAQVRQASK
jgi:hypothetical protein